MSHAYPRLSVTAIVAFVVSLVVQLVALVIGVRVWPEVAPFVVWVVPVLAFGYIVWRHRPGFGTAVLVGLAFWLLYLPSVVWLGLIVTGGDGP